MKEVVDYEVVVKADVGEGGRCGSEVSWVVYVSLTRLEGGFG